MTLPHTTYHMDDKRQQIGPSNNNNILGSPHILFPATCSCDPFRRHQRTLFSTMSDGSNASSDGSQGSDSLSSGDEDEYTASSGSSNTCSSCWSEDDEDASPGAASPKTMKSASTDRFLSLEMVKMLRISTSAGSLNPLATLASAYSPQKRRCSEGKQLSTSSKMVFAIQHKSPLDSDGQSKTTDSEVPKPKDKLQEILREQSTKSEYISHTLLTDFFVKGSVEAYSLELMNAVRQNDMESVRKFHSEGRQMQCCNKFGECIVHAVARRGSAEMLYFLMQEAGVSVRVTCDGGRTPLHDACWTASPNFDSIRLLLEDCPDFLLVTDARGFTPLDFAPRATHEQWNAFLDSNKELIKPRVLCATEYGSREHKG